MADTIDLAQYHNEQHQKIALAAIRTNDSAGSAICIECEEPIPLKRRQACPSATRCIDCQSDFEQNTKGVYGY